MSELVEMRQIQRNISCAVVALTNSLPVLRLYAKANTDISIARYYHALKSLKDLEILYLPAVARL